MAIKIMLQFNGKNLTIPINPEEISIKRSASNSDIDIIGLGKATRKGVPGLITTTIESFFPGRSSYFYTGVLPKTCVEFINTIWKTENTDNNVGKIVTSGLPTNLNMFFVINSFRYDHKAGEEDDIYYELEIKQYIPYGVKTVKTELTGLAAARAASPATQAPVQVVNTYTVQQGDCLWNIAKACTGNGANWPQLYELNKGVIGSNPNLIYPGQVLTLPEGWAVPTNVPKLSNVSSGGSRSSGSSSKAASGSAIDTVSQALSNISVKAVWSQTTESLTKGNDWFSKLSASKLQSKPLRTGGGGSSGGTGASGSF